MTEKDEDIMVRDDLDSDSECETSSCASSYDEEDGLSLERSPPRAAPQRVGPTIPPLGSRLAVLGGGQALSSLPTDGSRSPECGPERTYREPHGGQGQQAPMGIRIPTLALPSHLMPTQCPSPHVGTPRNIMKPPKLNLARTAWDMEEASTRADSQRGAGVSGDVRVSLLSHGLAISRLQLPAEAAAGQQLVETVRGRVGSSLGINPAELTFYEMRELGKEPRSDALASCSHLAVAVDHSGFSLGALEEVLADNKRLAVTAEKSTSTLESMQQMLREQGQALGQEQAKCAQLEAEARGWQEKCRTLERELGHVRQQLRRSDGLRMQGQQALDELRREFEALTRDLAADPHTWSSVAAHTPQPGLGPFSVSPRQIPVEAMSDRLALVLDKLCQEEILRRLERCLGVSPGGPQRQ